MAWYVQEWNDMGLLTRVESDGIVGICSTREGGGGSGDGPGKVREYSRGRVMYVMVG